MSVINFPQLFVLEPGLTTAPQLSIEDIARLIQESGSETLRARVVGKNRDGSVQLELPNGHRFAARLPVDAPMGGRVMLHARPDGTAQLLQITDARGTPLPTTPPAPPASPDSPPVIKPTLNHLLNLDTPAKDGMRIQLLPLTNRPLPAVGATVIGTITSLPEGGQQTLQLANGAQAKIPLPPVFNVGTEVTLKMTAPQQAEIQRLQPPPAPITPSTSSQPVLQQPSMMPQSTAPVPPVAALPTASDPRPTLPQQPQAPAPAPAQPTVQQPAPQPTAQPPIPAAPQTQPQQPVLPQPPAPTSPAVPTAPQPALPQQPAPQPMPQPMPQPVLQPAPQAPLPQAPVQAYTQQANNVAPPALPRTPTLQLASPAPDMMRQGQPVTVRFVAPQLPLHNMQTPQPQLPQLELPDGQLVQLRTPLAMTPNSTLQVQLRPDGQLAILAVREAPAQPASNPGPAPVVATVVAKGPQPETYVLNFKEGVRVPVLSPQPLPVGAKVMVQILPSGHAEILDILLPSSPQTNANQLLKFSLRWDSLQTALSQLNQKAPAMAQHIIERLPRVDSAFVPRLMQFVEMISHKSLDRSIGSEAANMLRALGLDHILQQDFSQLQQLQQRTDNPESWRALFFPYWEEKEKDSRQGSMFWRRQKDDENEQDSLRVIVHLSLSHLGRVQFDALLRGKQLVMKLRLQESVDPEFVDGLLATAQKALDDANLSGQIGVEQVTHFTVDPLLDMIKGNGSLNVKV